MSDSLSAAGEPLASLSGPSAGSNYPVHATSVTIGQGPRNDIVLDDDTVSTTHARLERSGTMWQVVDLGSRNGTFLDGRRLPEGEPTPLPDRADLGFGAVRLEFRSNVAAGDEIPIHSVPKSTPAPTPSSGGFRLPVWVVVLVILLIAAAVFLVTAIGEGPSGTEPVPEAPAPALEAVDSAIAA